MNVVKICRTIERMISISVLCLMVPFVAVTLYLLFSSPFNGHFVRDIIQNILFIVIILASIKNIRDEYYPTLFIEWLSYTCFIACMGAIQNFAQQQHNDSFDFIKEAMLSGLLKPSLAVAVGGLFTFIIPWLLFTSIYVYRVRREQ